MPARALRSRLAVLLVALLGLTSALTACSSDGSDGASTDAGEGTEASGPAPGVEAATQALDEERTVIDVRTPEEYEAGHVVDAELIDIQGTEFDAQIAELDPDGAYVVYCRSGNRSAAAARAMEAAGLDVIDGGGLDDMEAAGWPTEA